MIKRIISMTLVFALLVSVPVVSFAQEEGSSTGSEEAITEQSRNNPPRATIEERITERKNQLTERLDTAAKERIATRCKAAQQVLSTALTRVGDVHSNRQDVYNKLTARLNSLSERIGSQGVDITKLAETIQQTQALIDQFFVDFDVLINALDDATSIDCEDNPEDFNLALIDARSQVAALKASSMEIRSYVQNQVKAELTAIKDSLTSSNDQPTDNTGEES